MDPPDITQVIDQLKAIADSPPRIKIFGSNYMMQHRVPAWQWSPHTTLFTGLSTRTVQTAIKLKIFTPLVEQGGPVTAAELASPIGADVVFTARIARYLASHGFIAEVGEDTHQADHTIKTLSIEGFRAGINQTFQGSAPCFQVSLQFWQDTNFRNPSNVLNTPFQIAFKTQLPAFVWLQSNAELVADLGLWMTVVHNGEKTWLDVVDFESLIEGADPGTPVFVDIGGGIGRRVILQDLPVVIEHHKPPTEGVEKTVFDFWGEQPVKGAKTYYLRNILHDYPDEKALVILKNTIAALHSDSVILIDEMIIPDTGAHPHATEKDLVMLATLGSMERTQKQWDALLITAGLRAAKRLKYLE